MKNYTNLRQTDLTDDILQFHGNKLEFHQQKKHNSVEKMKSCILLTKTMNREYEICELHSHFIITRDPLIPIGLKLSDLQTLHISSTKIWRLRIFAYVDASIEYTALGI